MPPELTKQELHNLAMNIVGEDMKSKGFEFVGLKNKDLHFVIVRVSQYPKDAHVYDPVFMQTIKEHANSFDAKTYYAGVGLGNGTDYAKPVLKDQEYTMVYKGLQEIV
jgi:hypothetical protein